MELKPINNSTIITVNDLRQRFPKELLEMDFVKAIILMLDKYPAHWKLNMILTNIICAISPTPFYEFDQYEHLGLFFQKIQEQDTNDYPFRSIQIKLTHELVSDPFNTNLNRYICRNEDFKENLIQHFGKYGIKPQLKDLKCSIK